MLTCYECHRPLHLCVATWNVTVVRRWVEVATVEEIADAIDMPSPVGTALCMAAAVKKDHDIGNARILRCLFDVDEESSYLAKTPHTLVRNQSVMFYF